MPCKASKFSDCRQPAEDTATKLEAAIRSAGDASARMLHTARAAAAAAAPECTASVGLRDILAPKSGLLPQTNGIIHTQLADAIGAAARFPRLQVSPNFWHNQVQLHAS